MSCGRSLSRIREAWLAQWPDSQHQALFSTDILGMVINYAKERDLQGTKEVLEDNPNVELGVFSTQLAYMLLTDILS
jgi:hypothetical protein